MRHCIFLLLLAVSGLATTDAAATVINSNPNARISIVGGEYFSLSERAESVPEGFSVRLVNPHGQALPGLLVEFLIDIPLQGVPPPGAPPLPPVETYGTFAAQGFSVHALTDADGYARSGPFVGGNLSGSYTTTALVLVSRPENALLAGGPALVARFDIEQALDAPALPAHSSAALVLLAVLMLGLAARQRRRAAR